MPSFARPIQDISRGSWVTNSNGTSNLWATIDDDSANDADFVQSALGDNTSYEVLLSSVAPAVIPRDHSIILRGRKNQTNGNQKGVDVSLVQGDTVLGTQSFPSLPASVQQEVITMPRSMAAGITNYADLRVRFTPTGITSGGSARRRVIITGVVLRVPAAIDLVDDLLARWGVTEETNDNNPAIPVGDVWLSHSGSTGKGPNRWFAITDLFNQLKQRFPNSNLLEWRYRVAFALETIIDYERIRAEIVAGTYPLPPHQSHQEALDIVDQKIQNFIADAKAHEDESLVPPDLTTTTPQTTTTTGAP